MTTIGTDTIKYTFSGHDSFQCRQLWLKKGYDYLQSNKSFNDEDAVVKLGVGKNMVNGYVQNRQQPKHEILLILLRF